MIQRIYTSLFIIIIALPLCATYRFTIPTITAAKMLIRSQSSKQNNLKKIEMYRIQASKKYDDAFKQTIVWGKQLIACEKLNYCQGLCAKTKFNDCTFAFIHAKKIENIRYDNLKEWDQLWEYELAKQEK
jgi:hypothetical protein